jgi:hypothetical protein
MPRFTQLDKSLQLKVRQMEEYANTLGKDSAECRKLWNELKKSHIACFALSQKDGVYKACLRPVVGEKKIRCGIHSGYATGATTEEGKAKAISKLDPMANLVHGLYLDKDNTSAWLESLTTQEQEFSSVLEEKIRGAYEIPDDGISEVVLRNVVDRCIVGFRMIRNNRFGTSRHQADPVVEAMKMCSQMGWEKKDTGTVQQRTQRAMADILANLDALIPDEEEEKDPKTLN